MLAMEAWTPKSTKETDQYLRVSMHQQVSMYMYKKPDKAGRLTTDVRFYGPHHAKRAEVYATVVGTDEVRTEDRGTATTVVVTR